MTPAYWIASGFGIGRFPVAPGTAASLVAALIGAAALLVDVHLLIWLSIVATLGGLWAVHATKAKDDPGWIVIDEFAGQWIAMLGLTKIGVTGVIAAFALFRLFDILKPGPVGWADRKKGAFGVMADDVIAGLIVAAILYGATNLYPRLHS